jgi:rubredoxin-NAD+ reductase
LVQVWRVITSRVNGANSTPTKELVIISRDDGRNYSKPMLSTGYTKGKTARPISHAKRGEQMAEQLKADIRTFASVTAIDAKAKTVTVDGHGDVLPMTN